MQPKSKYLNATCGIIALLLSLYNLHLLNAKPNLLVQIGGPTGIGKSALAIALAKHYKTIVLSADSRQVYREMSIGTARVKDEEMEGIPHHLLGHRSIHKPYNAGMYEQEALEILDQHWAKHPIIFMVGGTGLYFKAVTCGLDSFPEVPADITDNLEKLLESQGIEQLQQMLESADPDYYEEVDLQNPMRLIRALGVIEASGQPFSSFRTGQIAERNFETLSIALTMDRNRLYDRIDDRVWQMLKDGLEQEAKGLYPYRDLRAVQTVGYTELFLTMDGLMDTYNAIELIQRNSRRYAKRQMTWFRNQDNWTEVPADDLDKAKEQTIQIIDAHRNALG